MEGASKPSLAEQFEHIAVVGAGTMGHGIARVYAQAGHHVSLWDIDAQALSQAQSKIQSGLETFVEAEYISQQEADETVDRINFVQSLETAVENVDFVTEAVPEKLELKKEVFGDLDRHTPKEAILATNTSGLSITEIATVVDDPARVIGTHWFNPAYIVPLVEVVPGEQTSEWTVTRTYELLEGLGKTPVKLAKEIPGFIGNRIQMAMAYEAFSLLDRGVASAEAIDKAVSAGFGFRLPVLGIFEKADQSGLDVHHDVESYLMDELDRGTDPNPVVSRLVAQGDKGLKTGKGVYDWNDANSDEVIENRDRRLLAVLEAYEAHKERERPR